MLSWVTRSDKNIKITIQKREDDDYPFALYMGDYLSILLTRDELLRLNTEANETYLSYDFGSINNA